MKLLLLLRRRNWLVRTSSLIRSDFTYSVAGIKRLYGAYILTGFAVHREQIEGLAAFSNSLSAVHCLLNMKSYGDYNF